MIPDEKYVGIPWKDGGRNFAGADCVGLTCLFLNLEYGFSGPVPASDTKSDSIDPLIAPFPFIESKLKRGDVVFFRDRKGELRHVATWLGNGRLLHTFKGGPSRIENGFRLAKRIGMEPVAAVPAVEAEVLALALSSNKLGDPSTWILLTIVIIASLASSFLMPLLARQGNRYGKYGFDGLVTQNSPEIPLPDILVEVTIAGNSPYTQLRDKNLSVSNPVVQAANKIVILCSGPILSLDLANFDLLINGLSYSDQSFSTQGVAVNPAQTEAEAVYGSIGGGSAIPSFSIYDGSYGTSVPVDVRAQFDRTFPVYGYSGCSYLVFRLINSQVFSSFNLNARLQGRLCRTYNSSGFIVNTSSGETLAAGDGVTTRFKLLNWDVLAVSSVTVNGTSYSPISPAAQSGNVFFLNATKGYVEFLTAPASSAVIVVTYTYYPRTWTQCPADLLVYLLTEKFRGKGFDASRIDWPRAVAFQTYCNAVVTWIDSLGQWTAPRYECNYAVDFRKPIQEHIQALLDSTNAYLFISGGKFVMKPRMQDSSVFSFNEGNILMDSFSSELVDRTIRPNRIKLFYHDQTAYNSETEIDLDDAVDQSSRASRVGNDGVVEQTLKYPAIDNAQQAQRVGQVLIRESVNYLWTCVFKTTVLGLALEPGDIVDVTHSSQPSWNQKLFRIEDIAYGDDDRMEMQFSEYVDFAYA